MILRVRVAAAFSSGLDCWAASGISVRMARPAVRQRSFVITLWLLWGERYLRYAPAPAEVPVIVAERIMESKGGSL